MNEKLARTAKRYMSGLSKMMTLGSILSLVAIGCGKPTPNCTQLWSAFDRNSIAEIGKLLQGGLSADCTNQKGETLLWSAIHRNDHNLVALLVSHGADPLKVVANTTPLKFAVIHSDSEIVHLLAGASAVKPIMDKVQGADITIAAAFRGDKAVLKALLVEGFSTTRLDKGGFPPLHLVANRDCAELLIDFGANINDQSNRDRQTPLHGAVSMHDPELVQYLLSHGANPNLRDVQGQTPLHYIAGDGVTGPVENMERIAKSLLIAKVDATLRDANGKTAYEIAVAKGNSEVAEALSSKPSATRGH